MHGIKMPTFMTSSKKRVLKWTLGLAIGIIIFIFFAGHLASLYVAKKIETVLVPVGGSFGDVNVNLFFRRISLNDLKIIKKSETSKSIPTSAYIDEISFEQISIYQFLINKTLNIGKIVIADGDICFNRDTFQKDSISAEREIPIKGISVDRFTIKNLDITIVRDSLKRYAGNINVDINHLASGANNPVSELKSYTLGLARGKINNLVIYDARGLYEFKIATLVGDTDSGSLEADSLLLVPQQTKYKFAHAAGKQTDRINLFIPKLKINGIRYKQLRDSIFAASHMTISSAEVYSFRDKRMPFREKKNKPLPMEALKRLKIAVEIDSISIADTRITYEEFPPEGFESGKVVFENLNATIRNVSNRIYYNKPKFATLKASAKLMGKGLIQASFYLPIDDSPYRAEGKIGSMNLSYLNRVLENLAFISIESGRLNELYFNFTYTDRSSTGSLMINYADLKIRGLKKERSAETNDLKSFLINTLIKNDKDKDTPAEKRTGNISFERDRKRQIFNYWWKSLLSGIKGSVLEN
jgi:hypothetical protein